MFLRNALEVSLSSSKRISYVSFCPLLMLSSRRLIFCLTSLMSNSPQSLIYGFYKLMWKKSSCKCKSIFLQEKLFKLNIAPKNQKSIFLQARLSKCQPRLGVFNLAPKLRKLQENYFKLNIAPKTKNQFSCRRGCQNVNLACGFLI